MRDSDEPRLSAQQDVPGDLVVCNPFDSDSVARRYVVGRPYYHRAAIDLAADRLGLSRVRLALDLGCGTGLSSRALRERADQVVAIDMSSAMLQAAESLDGVWYLAASAERIPLRDSSVDLATVGAALHWFDHQRAFPELARVLRAQAALVVYSDFFHGRLAGRPAFTDWLMNSYLPDYPSPARHAQFDPAAAEAAGFTTPSHDERDVLIPLTCAQLADYLVSQSNAAVAIESGRISAGALRDRVISETSAFFPDGETADVVFGIRAWTTVRRT
jgi:SAM-dependent methyltransferase